MEKGILYVAGCFIRIHKVKLCDRGEGNWIFFEFKRSGFQFLILFAEERNHLISRLDYVQDMNPHNYILNPQQNYFTQAEEDSNYIWLFCFVLYSMFGGVSWGLGEEWWQVIVFHFEIDVILLAWGGCEINYICIHIPPALSK